MNETEDTKTNEQVTDENNKNWLEQESSQINVHDDYDELPSLQFVENKIITFEVDFSEPFIKWTGKQGTKDVMKAIIPVTEKGEKKNLWLNVKNPLYGEIVKLGIKGQKIFKVMQSGNQAETKYNIVEED